VDTSRIFVGSFNLDPRSAHLNTEMGAVIESETLARQLAQAFATTIPEAAYEGAPRRGRLGPPVGGAHAGRETVLTTEPHSGAMRRLWVRFLALLPIEWLL
jgi:putative cardiolipin synthase